MNQKTIIIFSEVLTLAHFMRPLTLALELQKNSNYKIIFAVSDIPHGLEHLISNLNVVYLKKSITTEQFLQAVSNGTHPFTVEILEEKIKEDLELIKKCNPDLLIGDMRLSLHVSSQILKKCYINLSNSQWDSSTSYKNIVPDLPITRILGTSIGSLLIKLMHKKIMMKLALPFNIIAKKYNVKEYGSYNEVISSGDYVFYFDPKNLNLTHKYNNDFSDFNNYKKIEVGAFDYSLKSIGNSNAPFKINNEKNYSKVILISLGSSGPNHLLPKIISSVSQLKNVHIILVTAGAKVNLKKINTDLSNVTIQVEKYVPYNEVLQKVDLVISNGGSSTTYPALLNGVPVLSIPMNYDQHLFTNSISHWNVGISIRSDSFSKKNFINSINLLIENSNSKSKVHQVKQLYLSENPVETISYFVKQFFKTSLLSNYNFAKPNLMISDDLQIQK